MTTWAVILAGGESQRFGANKLAQPLGHQSVLAWSVGALVSHPTISGVIIATPKSQETVYQNLLLAEIESSGYEKIDWVTGGETRRDSVWSALKVLPAEVNQVLIQDAARPFVTHAMVDAVLQSLQSYSGAIVAMPMRDTIKRANQLGLIEETISREHLWQAQTPQAFRREILVEAHQNISAGMAVTDDAQLVEAAGLGTVQLVKGNSGNLKLTYPEDWQLAEAIASGVFEAR